MDEYARIAGGTDRPSLERLEAYLRHHGIDCDIREEDHELDSWRLLVAPADTERARRILEEIARGGPDPEKPEEVVEISFDGTERTEVATWLQILLDEEDREGTPIYFFRPEYEAVLDALHASGRVEIPVYLVKSLKVFIPGRRRILMSRGLQEFFNLIDSVAGPQEN